jgi:hypothetical protein
MRDRPSGVFCLLELLHPRECALRLTNKSPSSRICGRTARRGDAVTEGLLDALRLHPCREGCAGRVYAPAHA